jgi:hypothetical protein
MSFHAETPYRLLFVTFVHRKLGKVYEGGTKICKFLCVGIYMAVMWIAGTWELIRKRETVNVVEGTRDALLSGSGGSKFDILRQ